MPFDAWGMTDAAASTLTSTDVTEAQMDAAVEEIYDYIGWRPDEDNFGPADPDSALFDVRTRALGRAIAWQAAWRTSVDASADDGRVDGITAESIGDGDYSYQREPGYAETPLIAPRARTLLASGGWLARSANAISMP